MNLYQKTRKCRWMKFVSAGPISSIAENKYRFLVAKKQRVIKKTQDRNYTTGFQNRVGWQ